MKIDIIIVHESCVDIRGIYIMDNTYPISKPTTNMPYRSVMLTHLMYTITREVVNMHLI